MVFVLDVVWYRAGEVGNVDCERLGRGRSRWCEVVKTRNYRGRTVAVGLDARAADCYDIIVRRGGGAGLVVDKADERRRGRASATVAVDGKLANWAGRTLVAQTRAKGTYYRYTRCRQRVSRLVKMWGPLRG